MEQLYLYATFAATPKDAILLHQKGSISQQMTAIFHLQGAAITIQWKDDNLLFSFSSKPILDNYLVMEHISANHRTMTKKRRQRANTSCCRWRFSTEITKKTIPLPNGILLIMVDDSPQWCIYLSFFPIAEGKDFDDCMIMSSIAIIECNNDQDENNWNRECKLCDQVGDCMIVPSPQPLRHLTPRRQCAQTLFDFLSNDADICVNF